MVASSNFLALLLLASATAQNYFFFQTVYSGKECRTETTAYVYPFFLNECRNSRTSRLVGSDLVVDWYSTSNCAANTYVGTDYSLSELPPNGGCVNDPEGSEASYKVERISGKFPYNTLARDDRVTLIYDDSKCSGDVSFFSVEKGLGCVQNQACQLNSDSSSAVFCGDSFRFPSDAAGLTQSITRTAQVIDTASSTVSEVTSRVNGKLTEFTATTSDQSSATVTVSGVRSTTTVPKGSETFSTNGFIYSYKTQVETYIRTLKSGTVGRLQSGSYTFYSSSVKLGFSFLLLAFLPLALLF